MTDSPPFAFFHFQHVNAPNTTFLAASKSSFCEMKKKSIFCCMMLLLVDLPWTRWIAVFNLFVSRVLKTRSACAHPINNQQIKHAQFLGQKCGMRTWIYMKYTAKKIGCKKKEQEHALTHTLLRVLYVYWHFDKIDNKILKWFLWFGARSHAHVTHQNNNFFLL